MSAYSLKYSGIIEILKATPEELDRLERLMLEESGSDGEYHAAAVYCKRNNVPLFLIDDNGVISPEELARIDVTQIDDLVAFCEERGALGYSSRNGDLTSRNIFMGSVINEVARRFSGRGVHVGGANHIISEEGMVLTDTIRAPIVGSEIFSLSRRYIN